MQSNQESGKWSGSFWNSLWVWKLGNPLQHLKKKKPLMVPTSIQTCKANFVRYALNHSVFFIVHTQDYSIYAQVILNPFQWHPTCQCLKPLWISRREMSLSLMNIDMKCSFHLPRWLWVGRLVEDWPWVYIYYSSNLWKLMMNLKVLSY